MRTLTAPWQVTAMSANIPVRPAGAGAWLCGVPAHFLRAAGLGRLRGGAMVTVGLRLKGRDVEAAQGWARCRMRSIGCATQCIRVLPKSRMVCRQALQRAHRS